MSITTNPPQSVPQAVEAFSPGHQQHWRFIEYNPRRATRGAPAARVEVDQDGDWLWMTPKDIRLNIRDHGEHPELAKTLAAYKA